MIGHLFAILIQALVTLLLINRYIAGLFLQLFRGRKLDETTDVFEPIVGVVIPMFNEGAAIRETLESLLAQDYPAKKLLITVVDDCSTDDSYSQARAIALRSGGRIRVLRNAKNMGKRRSITRAVRELECEIIVSVDSDVVVDKDAIRQLIRRFTSPRIAAVGGRVDVRNKHDNWISRMETVKYYYGYFFLKNLEWAFRRVMCLSGCLTAYRRSVLLELEPLLEHRQILGVPIKYGEDRYLTRQIIKAGYLTTMTLDAVCRTFVPTTLAGYFSQQLRWRRSNIVDYSGGMSHVWRLNPLIAIHFFAQFCVLLAYPVLVLKSIHQGTFFDLMIRQVVLASLLGVVYWLRVRKLPAHDRVSAWSMIPIALVLPVTYAFLTPVALFTLDSGSWETREHEVPAEDDAEPAPGLVSEEATARVSRVELPAA